jgi:hypothetical protein
MMKSVPGAVATGSQLKPQSISPKLGPGRDRSRTDSIIVVDSLCFSSEVLRMLSLVSNPLVCRMYRP